MIQKYFRRYFHRKQYLFWRKETQKQREILQQQLKEKEALEMNEMKREELLSRQYEQTLKVFQQQLAQRRFEKAVRSFYGFLYFFICFPDSALFKSIVED